MNQRKGRAARRLAQYRSALRSYATTVDTSKSAMARSLYYGSKCYKPASLRRPHHGGKVHS